MVDLLIAASVCSQIRRYQAQPVADDYSTNKKENGQLIERMDAPLRSNYDRAGVATAVFENIYRLDLFDIDPFD